MRTADTPNLSTKLYLLCTVVKGQQIMYKSVQKHDQLWTKPFPKNPSLHPFLDSLVGKLHVGTNDGHMTSDENGRAGADEPG